MGFNSNISNNQRPQGLNKILIKEYEYSLFCFALAFANVFINKTFLRKSLTTLSSTSRQRFVRHTQNLVALKKKVLKTLKEYLLFKYPINTKKLSILEKVNFDPVCQLSEFLRFIDNEVNENSYWLSNPYFKTKRGIYMWLETKIAMIFSYIMNKKVIIDRKSERKIKEKYKKWIFLPKLNIEHLNNIYNDFFFNNIFVKLEMNKFEPNWDDIFNLMDWFYNYTSYRSLLKETERNQIKERIRKYNAKYLEKTLVGLLATDLLIFISQNYFEETKDKTPISIQYKGIYYPLYYPSCSITFGKDFIKIGEIKANYLIYEKYTKLNSDFIKTSEKKLPVKKDKIPYEIKFANNKKISFK